MATHTEKTPFDTGKTLGGPQDAFDLKYPRRGPMSIHQLESTRQATSRALREKRPSDQVSRFRKYGARIFIAVGLGIPAMVGVTTAAEHINISNSTPERSVPTVPSANEPHRQLLVGDTKDGIVLYNVGSIADYIHKKKPEISRDEAFTLITTENSQDQINQGIPKDEVEPLKLLPNQGIRLPSEYGVGDPVVPEQIQP